jgi:hypothetical protein
MDLSKYGRDKAAFCKQYNFFKVRRRLENYDRKRGNTRFCTFTRVKWRLLPLGKKQYQTEQLWLVLELHTYSSLNAEFFEGVRRSIRLC